MENNFYKHLSEVLDVPEESVKLCSMHYNVQYFKKGSVLVKEGEINTDRYFVEKGLLRMFSIDKNAKEHVIQFAPEGWIISDSTSQMLKEKSRFFIEAIEDSEVVVLSDEFFFELSQISPKVSERNQRLMLNHIKNLQNRVNALISTTAEERYMDFLRKYPNIMLRVPQWMVASYLGITPESLSRVRKELAKKNFEL